jgi:hypothetical protein
MKPTSRSGLLLRVALTSAMVLAACAGPPLPSPATEAPSEAATTDVAAPPAALLTVDGAPAVAGELGSYTYLGQGSDSPWLPATMLQPVEAGAGGRLVVRLANGEPIARGSARVAQAGDTEGTETEPLGLSQEQQAVVIVGPGPGSWVLAVELDYADEAGSGLYFWRLEVR